MHLITRPILDALKFANTLSLQAWCINPLLEIKLNPSAFSQLRRACDIENCLFITTSANSIRIFENLSLSLNLSHIQLVTNSKIAYQMASLLGIRVYLADCDNLLDFTELLATNFNQYQELIYLSGNYSTLPIEKELQKYHLNASAIIIYDSVQRGFIQPTITNILEGKIDSCSLFSARTAQIFLEEVIKHNLEESFANIDIWAISTKVAKIIDEIKVKKIYIMSDLSNDMILNSL